MAGIFLSYSRGDRALAEQIVKGLRGIGVDVWWDEDMPGVNWQQELERQIKEMAAVVVVWTVNSAGSNNVRDEARLGLNSEKLINVIADIAQPPFPFDRVNALPLSGWSGREPHHGWTRLVQTIEAMLVLVGSAAPGEITSALAARDQQIRLRQSAIEGAQEIFQDAQARDGEAAAAASAASAALNSAEQQLQWVVEKHASPALLHAAQEELETARTANDLSVATQHAVKAQLSEAARELSRARAALDRLFSEAGEPVTTIAPATLPKRRSRPKSELDTINRSTPSPVVDPVRRTKSSTSSENRMSLKGSTNRWIELLFSFRGRSDRREFWLCFVIYQVLYTLILGIIFASQNIKWAEWVVVPSLLFLILPAFAVAAKRVRDANRNAMWGVVLLTTALPFWAIGLGSSWPLAAFVFLANPAAGALIATSPGDIGRVASMSMLLAGLINIGAALCLGLVPGTPGPNRFGSPSQLFAKAQETQVMDEPAPERTIAEGI